MKWTKPDPGTFLRMGNTKYEWLDCRWRPPFPYTHRKLTEADEMQILVKDLSTGEKKWEDATDRDGWRFQKDGHRGLK